MKLKPVAAAVLATCFASAPVIAANNSNGNMHRTFKPASTRHQASIEFLTPYDSFARDVINKNQTKGGPGVQVGRRLKVSGLLNVDGKVSNRAPLYRTPGFRDESTSDIYVNNANFLFDGMVNRCVSYHVGLAYLRDSVNDLGANRDGGSVFRNGRVTVDEAFVTVSEFDKSPFYVRAGKMYADFGQYAHNYPLTYSLTQLMEQTRATGVQVGAVTGYGFYASASLLSGLNSRARNRAAFGLAVSKLDNYTAKLGYQGELQGYEVNANVSWLNDAQDVDYVEFERNSSTSSLAAFTNRRAQAWSGHGDVSFGSRVGSHYKHTFMVGGDYVSAERLVKEAPSKITAWGIEGAYAFRAFNHDSKLAAHFSTSDRGYFIRNAADSQSPFLPKWLVSVDYAYHVFPYTTVVLEYSHARNFHRFVNDYSAHDNEDSGAVRLSVDI